MLINNVIRTGCNRLLTLCFGLLILSACAATNGNQIQPTADPFQATLAKEYNALALRQLNALDLTAYRHFLKKAAAASNGEFVTADSPKSRALNKSDYPKIWTAWTRLEHIPPHVRSAFPKDSARAQVSFDCWIEERGEKIKSKTESTCEKEWNELIAQLECPAGCENDPYQDKLIKSYELTFDLNSAALDTEAKDILDQVVRELSSHTDATALITGYTDRAGSRSHNITLARKRAQALAAALHKKGITKPRVKINARGESDQAIMTDDDIKLEENRRVKIDIFTQHAYTGLEQIK